MLEFAKTEESVGSFRGVGSFEVWERSGFVGAFLEFGRWWWPQDTGFEEESKWSWRGVSIDLGFT